MSHYKPYPAYRDSNVEWIGQVPEHWSTLRLANIGHLVKGNGGTKQDDAANGLPCVRYGDLYTTYDFLIREIKKFIRPETASDYTAIKYGDLLLAASGETFEEIGKSAVILDENPAFCGGDVIILRPERKIDPVFLAFAAGSVSAQAQKSLMGKGFTVIHVYGNELRDLVISAPPKEEQDLIGAAIERETARIDALITKKTRLIELLKEKRHALIDHAVTKGLNPDAPMQDSDVEWLGEIPAHWLVAQLGKISIARCDGPFGSGLKSEHYQPDGVRVVRLQNIGWASFKDGNEAFISHDHWQGVLGCGHEVLPNDVLIGGLGDDKNPLGRACVAPSNLGPAMVKADCYRFRLNTSRAEPEFIALALSATARSECGYLATGATRDRLNLGLASARVVALPPLNEQIEIVATLNRDTARIDLLTEKTQRSIDLLKERRAAFITAAVTGQIDLRESA